ncbi:MAG: GNAT family N-acetyltransferase [Chloroflexota bacterium]|nr:GNAT family N-acetyltransferase [Chloroflexota bacterium]
MAPEGSIRVRDWDERDSDFYQAVVHRIIPERTASPRDMAAVSRFMDQVVADAGSRPGGVETHVAVDADDRPLGLYAIRLDFDHFTNHPRACVEVLVVSDAAEGKGVGRSLMRHAEAWGRQHGCKEVVLDVFADNDAAIAFYRRVGYQPDHFRMTKSLVSDADPD